jgi:hypothetical protein
MCIIFRNLPAARQKINITKHFFSFPNRHDDDDCQYCAYTPVCLLVCACVFSMMMPDADDSFIVVHDDDDSPVMVLVVYNATVIAAAAAAADLAIAAVVVAIELPHVRVGVARH